GNGGLSRLHRQSQLQRRARESPRGSRSRIACLCGDLSAISVSFARRYGRSWIRRCEVRLHASPAREVAPGKALERTEERQSTSCFDRSLPVLLQRAEGTR